jgi:AcrR family transcriptional regulator
MRKLADRVGVSRTAPYHHFEDKQQLLCAIAQRGFEKQSRALADNDASGEPFKARLRAFVHGYLRFALDNPQYYDLMFSADIWKADGIDPVFREQAHMAFRQFVERIDRWQRNGDLAQDVSALRKAQITWSTMHGLARLMIDGIYVDSQAMLAMCDVATDMFLQTLDGGEEA